MRPILTRLVTFAALALAIFLAPRAVHGQATTAVAGTRFHVASVGDSTFTFAIGDAKWVKKGAKGTAVDPKRHDALVAQFEVISIENGTATALVTAQTSAVTTQNDAMLDRPMGRSWKLGGFGAFGAGMLGGAVAGAIVASLIAH